MSSEPVVLIVDRNQRNLELLTQFLAKEGYTALSASTYEILESIVKSETTLGLALIDITGFTPDIWLYCARLADKDIPLLVLSSRQSQSVQKESFAHGARGVLVKPLVMKDLSALIKSMMRQE